MSEEEILHYAKIFSNAIGDVHKLEIYQGAEKKTIAEPELWEMVIDLLSKKDKVIEELERENDELRRLLEEWKLEQKTDRQPLKRMGNKLLYGEDEWV